MRLEISYLLYLYTFLEVGMCQTVGDELFSFFIYIYF
jgi:hypothetical protein